jgi:hypothetical protein
MLVEVQVPVDKSLSMFLRTIILRVKAKMMEEGVE